MATPNALELIPPLYPEADPPKFDLIAQIPLAPDLQPKDLGPIRKRVVAAVMDSTVDAIIIEYVAGELVANAAGLNAEGLAEEQAEFGVALSSETSVPPVEELERHAESITVGRSHNGKLILGVRDDMPFWLSNPQRPKVDDGIGGLTGRGAESVKELTLSATVSTDPEGKTVWVEL